MCFAGCVYTEVALSPTCSSMWPLGRSVHVTSDFHCERAIDYSGNANNYNGIDRWTFSPWGSLYRTSHWIDRSTSGLHPYCCLRGGTAVRVFSLSSWPLVNSFWINKWRKNSQNKSRKWLTAWRMIHTQIPQQTRLCRACSGSPQLGILQLSCMKLRAVPVRVHDRVHTIACSCCHYSLAILSKFNWRHDGRAWSTYYRFVYK